MWHKIRWVAVENLTLVVYAIKPARLWQMGPHPTADRQHTRWCRWTFLTAACLLLIDRYQTVCGQSGGRERFRAPHLYHLTSHSLLYLRLPARLMHGDFFFFVLCRFLANHSFLYWVFVVPRSCDVQNRMRQLVPWSLHTAYAQFPRCILGYLWRKFQGCPTKIYGIRKNAVKRCTSWNISYKCVPVDSTPVAGTGCLSLPPQITHWSNVHAIFARSTLYFGTNILRAPAEPLPVFFYRHILCFFVLGNLGLRPFLMHLFQVHKLTPFDSSVCDLTFQVL